MFGYVVADKAGLTPEQLTRYRECYCGLCRALGQRHRLAGRLTLTYDMVFLVLLLGSLYDPDTDTGSARCAAHPFRPQEYRIGPLAEYAADMNLALAYHNCMDDWHDDRSLPKLLMAWRLRKSYRRIRGDYPRQCAAMERCMETLTQVEAGTPDPDSGANSFGLLMGELFVLREDNWSNTLRRAGAALGRFIYLTDAALDREADRKHHRYNPAEGMDDRLIYNALTLFIGEATAELDRLPLVDNLDLLNNILFNGVWTRWQSAQKRGKKDDK